MQDEPNLDEEPEEEEADIDQLDNLEGVDPVAEFEEEIDRLVALGIDAPDVIKAYKSTNMDKELVRLVLEALCRNEPVPDAPGVWTSKDDAMLRYIQMELLGQDEATLSDADRTRRKRMVKQHATLVDKHGEAALEFRRQFLELWAVPDSYAEAAQAADRYVR